MFQVVNINYLILYSLDSMNSMATETAFAKHGIIKTMHEYYYCI